MQFAHLGEDLESIVLVKEAMKLMKQFGLGLVVVIVGKQGLGKSAVLNVIAYHARGEIAVNNPDFVSDNGTEHTTTGTWVKSIPVTKDRSIHLVDQQGTDASCDPVIETRLCMQMPMGISNCAIMIFNETISTSNFEDMALIATIRSVARCTREHFRLFVLLRSNRRMDPAKTPLDHFRDFLERNATEGDKSVIIEHFGLNTNAPRISVFVTASTCDGNEYLAKAIGAPQNPMYKGVHDLAEAVLAHARTVPSEMLVNGETMANLVQRSVAELNAAGKVNYASLYEIQFQPQVEAEIEEAKRQHAAGCDALVVAAEKDFDASLITRRLPSLVRTSLERLEAIRQVYGPQGWTGLFTDAIRHISHTDEVDAVVKRIVATWSRLVANVFLEQDVNITARRETRPLFRDFDTYLHGEWDRLKRNAMLVALQQNPHTTTVVTNAFRGWLTVARREWSNLNALRHADAAGELRGYLTGLGHSRADGTTGLTKVVTLYGTRMHEGNRGFAKSIDLREVHPEYFNSPWIRVRQIAFNYSNNIGQAGAFSQDVVLDVNQDRVLWDEYTGGEGWYRYRGTYTAKTKTLHFEASRGGWGHNVRRGLRIRPGHAGNVLFGIPDLVTTIAFDGVVDYTDVPFPTFR